MGSYRKKPIVVDAEQQDADFHVETLEGWMQGKRGDWLITGVEGEQYPCRDSVFQKTYEPEETSQLQAPLTSEVREALEEMWQDHIETTDYAVAVDAIRRILDAPVQRCGGCRWYDEMRCEHGNGFEPMAESWYCADWQKGEE